MRKRTVLPLLVLLLVCLLTDLSVFASAQQVASISLSPTSAVGGTTVTGTITLTSTPAGALTVFLQSTNSTVAAAPNSILIPAGSSSATVPIATNPVASNQSVTLSAYVSGQTPKPSAALTVTTGFTRTFTPTDDVYVRAGYDTDPASGHPYGDTNYQTYDPLNLNAKTDYVGVNNVNRAVYLKFNLTGLHTAPASASLHLTSVQHANGGAMNLLCYAASNNATGGSAWTEGTLTCNTAPNLDLSTFTHSPSSDSTLDQEAITYEAGLIPFNLTSFIASHLGQVVSVQIIAQETSPLNPYSAQFNSKENSSGQPSLVLTFTGINNDVPLPGWAEDALAMDSAGSEGVGPSSADGIDLASGVYENNPDPDISVYNPYGPSISYQRRYRSKEALRGYALPGLSVGWTDNFDLSLSGAGGSFSTPLMLTYPNGAQETLTPQLISGIFYAFSVPAGTPLFVKGTASGTAGQWSSLTITQKDESVLSFLPSNYRANVYVLEAITDQLGNSLTLYRDTSDRLTSLVATANPAVSPAPAPLTLLSLSYTSGNTTLTDASGNQVTYTFDGSGRLSTVTQVGNSSLRWQYGYTTLAGAQLLTSVAAPDPTNPTTLATHTLSYGDGLTISPLTDLNLFQRTYNYNPAGTSVSVTDNLGNLAQSWTQLLAGSLDAGAKDQNGGVSGVTYGSGNTLYEPTSTTNALNQSLTLGYDTSAYDATALVPFGNLTTLTEPTSTGATLTTTLQYDYSAFPLGRLKQVQVGTKTPTNLTYYANGLVHTLSTPKPGTAAPSGSQVTTTYTYTPLGNIATLQVPSPKTSSSSVTYTFNYTTDGSYSQPERLGQPLSISDPNSPANLTHLRYDAHGNITSVVDANGFETDYTYNVADQLTQVLYPPTLTGGGRAYTLFSYAFPGGALISQTLYVEKSAPPYDAAHGTPFQSITRTPGKEDEDRGVSGALPTLTFVPDGLYRLSQLSDINTHTTSYNYDPVSGQMSKQSFPLFNTSTHFDIQEPAYDAAYNLTRFVDGLNRTTTYTRNNASNQDDSLSSVTYPLGTLGSVGYTYDAYARLTTVTDGTGSRSYTYDDLDNVLTETTVYATLPSGHNTFTLTYAYTDDARRASLSTPVGTISYGYDYNGNLLTVAYPWSDTQTSLYYPNRWLKNHTNSLTKTAYTYTPRGLLQSLSNTYPSDLTQLSNYTSFTYDTAGNRTGMTLTVASIPSYSGLFHAAGYSGSVGYGYDAQNHLSGENNAAATTSGGGTNQYAVLPYNYGYSADGADFLSGLGSAAFSANADNQNANTGFGYDGEGNTTSYNGAALSYDVEDRLTTAATAFTAGYRDDDLRAWKQTTGTGVRTYFLYDGTQVLCEINASGVVQNTYGWGSVGLLERYNSPSALFYVYTYDPSGNMVMRHNARPSADCDYTSLYDAFGAQHGCLDPLTQTESQQQDAIGFGGQWGYYTDNETFAVGSAPTVRMPWTLNTLRYFDPATGRFLTRDPIGYDGGINLYTFAGNNPVNNIDSLGLTEGWDLFFLAWDVYNLAADQITHAPRAVKNLDAVAFGADILLALIPGTPSGPGHIATAGAKATALAEAHIPLAVRGLQGTIHTASTLVHFAGSGGQGFRRVGGYRPIRNDRPYVYQIFNKTKGKVYKYGISANRDGRGRPMRLESQLGHLNSHSSDEFVGRILRTFKSTRSARAYETELIGRFIRRNGRFPEGNQRLR